MIYSLASDLHLDHPQPKTPPFEQTIIIAGDTGNGLIGLAYLNKLKAKGHTVFAVTGNHEHYGNTSRGRTYEETEADFYTGLENQPKTLDIKGFRIIGTNGWYCVQNEFHWNQSMNDGRYTNIPAKQLNMIACNEASFIYEQLDALPDNMKAIIVTHTAPCESSLDPKYDGDPTNCYYYNPHMEAIIERFNDKITIWHHGHTHAAVDIMYKGVRIVTNPRGYPRENPNWKPLRIEL